MLLLDRDGRVLLLHGEDGGRRYWFTVGGGTEPGESLPQAAARELFEETGLRCAPGDLGEPVHEELAEFSLQGSEYRQHNTFFVLRVQDHDVDTTGWDTFESAFITGHRWWSPEELRTTEELYYPRCLLELVAC